VDEWVLVPFEITISYTSVEQAFLPRKRKSQVQSQSDLLTRRVIRGLAGITLVALFACNAAGSVVPERQATEALAPSLNPAAITPTVVIPMSTSTPTSTPVALGDISTRVAYVLPLTIRHVTDTSATLFFELSEPAEGILLYESAGSGQQVLALPAGSTKQIELDGLTPGTEYRATIGLAHDGDSSYQQPGFRGQPWGVVSFRTQQAGEPLRIGVIGDSGFGQQVTFDLATQMAGTDLDLVLHTGDVVYNIEQNVDAYEAYALKYYLPFAPLLHRMPVYTVIGNHDVEWEALYQGTPFIYRAFPPFVDPRVSTADARGLNQWYAFAYGNVQFLMLDTQTFFNEEGRADQLAWLTERLADGRFAYSIPVFHVPPFTSGLHPYDGLAVRSEWLPLFEASKVPLVLSGHDHNYERLVANGITYIVSGGGSSVLYNQGVRMPESAVFAHQMHFVLIELHADRIDLKALAPGGEVIDQTTVPLSKD
jgi:predicted phosphodiesterase